MEHTAATPTYDDALDSAISGQFAVDLSPEPQPESALPSAPSVELYVAGAGPYDKEVSVPWLAAVLSLDVWGTSLLNSKARAQMSAAAALLSVVYLFEMTAWSLLFNVVVNAGEWALNSGTVVALCLGFLFSSTVFLFERNFICADVTGGGSWRRWLAYCLRVGVIVVSAVVTAHPIELLIFNNEIKEVLRDEAVYEQALAYHRQYGGREAKPKDGHTGDGEQSNWTPEERMEFKRLEHDLAELKSKIDEKQDTLERRGGNVGETRRRLAVANSQLMVYKRRLAALQDDDEKDTQKYQIGRLRQKIEELKKNRTLNKEEREEVRRTVTDLTRQVEKVDIRRKKFLTDVRKRHGDPAALVKQQHEKCIQQLMKKAPGSPLDQCTSFTDWNPYRAGFVKQVAVLYRLVGGRGAQLPSHAKSRELDEIHVPHVALPSAGGKPMDSDEVKVMSRIYLASFAIACIIPLLTLAFKLLQGEELKAYYSTRAQVVAGNRQAELVRKAQSALHLLESRPAALHVRQVE